MKISGFVCLYVHCFREFVVKTSGCCLHTHVYHGKGYEMKTLILIIKKLAPKLLNRTKLFIYISELTVQAPTCAKSLM